MLRWHHPVLGYIPTKEFIPAAATFGLMPEIGEWVLAQACKVLQDWSKKKRLKILRFQSILVLIILCNLTLSTL
ncbi:EAL domain-containing protein [Acinetobacter baumannii]